ncbi:RES family NAD+ phosphorylase [Vibrio tubiashii]|uniref:RES family NAD+ phosphorylase n=1 Tax=Vibrio tubiashii TaxID=29498 RepID=UPI001EFE9862|nr:RES family NAD+ phosphorylase [Vibrio tubiashii]MCG9579814.1 RES family NAD+ phosphorylase [Vibrio tubiashii]
MILFRALHKKYVDSWNDYEKGSSFKEGARWNLAGTPTMYFSANVQNAMLELTNYAPTPKMANGLFVMGVFECPSLRLKEVQPENLPTGWEQYPFHKDTQQYGSDVLLNNDYDGLIVPSCAINTELAASLHNEVRRSLYANIVLNPEKETVKKMTMVDTYTPVYSNRMFTA